MKKDSYYEPIPILIEENVEGKKRNYNFWLPYDEDHSLGMNV